MKEVKKKYNIRLKIKKNDIVKVTSGVDAGKQGKVLEVYPRKNRAIVEGVNMVKKHQKPNADNPQGGILEQEAPIHISNLLYVDAKGNTTRVGYKVEDGKKVRYSKKSGDIIK